MHKVHVIIKYNVSLVLLVADLEGLVGYSPPSLQPYQGIATKDLM